MRLPKPGGSARRAIVHWGQILLVLVAVAAVLWRSEVQEARVDALVAALGDEQSNAEAQGVDPIAPDAEELLENPTYTPAPGPSGPTGPPGPPGPALSASQIQAAFATYFASHPYEFEPSAAELTAAFASVLSEHPDLLNEELYAAMAAYLAENPPPPGPAGADGKDGTDGKDGAQGDPGRPPNAEEIRAQIEAYVDEHGLPLCPAGTSPGPLTPLTTDGPVEIVGCIAASE